MIAQLMSKLALCQLTNVPVQIQIVNVYFFCPCISLHVCFNKLATVVS